MSNDRPEDLWERATRRELDALRWFVVYYCGASPAAANGFMGWLISDPRDQAQTSATTKAKYRAVLRAVGPPRSSENSGPPPGRLVKDALREALTFPEGIDARMRKTLRLPADLAPWWEHVEELPEVDSEEGWAGDRYPLG